MQLEQTRFLMFKDIHKYTHTLVSFLTLYVLYHTTPHEL